MTPLTILLRRLEHASRSGTVASLVGDGWGAYWRVLHPAERFDGQEYKPVRWSEIAEARGVDFDPARSTWYEVSGVEPHSDGLARSGIAVEPLEGADDASRHRLLIDFLVGSAGDETVGLAEWAGYGDAKPVAGALDVVIAREPYRVLTVGRDDVPLSTGFRANYAVGDSGLWLVGADMDLMSTYVAVSASLTLSWPSELEVAQCSAGDRLS